MRLVHGVVLVIQGKTLPANQSKVHGYVFSKKSFRAIGLHQDLYENVPSQNQV
jgi:hypothetical protein